MQKQNLYRRSIIGCPAVDPAKQRVLLICAECAVLRHGSVGHCCPDTCSGIKYSGITGECAGTVHTAASMTTAVGCTTRLYDRIYIRCKCFIGNDTAIESAAFTARAACFIFTACTK